MSKMECVLQVPCKMSVKSTGRGAVRSLRNVALALGSLGLPTRKAAVLAVMTATENDGILVQLAMSCIACNASWPSRGLGHDYFQHPDRGP